jgi:UDP-glucose 4-epimerase
MRLLLTGLGKKGLYEQLFGDLTADTSSLIAAGFRYLPGDPHIEAMAIEAQKA